MEVIMAMVIFVMLAAAVFGILGAILQASSTLQDNQNRQEQLEAFQAFLQQQMRGLTARDTFITYQRGDGEGLTFNGVVWGSASLVTVLDAKIQPNGYYQLRLVRLSKANVDPNNAAAQSNPIPFLVEEVQADDPSLAWSSLIRDVRLISWRFQGQAGTPWVTDWSTGSPSNKPNVAEVTLQLAGDNLPTVMDFWLTNPQPEPEPAVQPAASTTNSTPP